jgi:phosphoribosylamine--glycine ligase
LKILVIGGGAREHAITWKLAQSPKAGEIYVAPGNAGTAQIARNVKIGATDIESLSKFAAEKKIDLTIVGPETPLAAGIVDRFQAMGLAVFGPSRAAARIESSKVFSKDLMHKYNIHCAASRSFSTYAEAREYLEKQQMPIVIKADGLAAGKGVTVAATMEQALAALSEIMEAKVFGEAGNMVIIEEKMEGREMSAFAVADGETVRPMISACDYKAVFDGDKGPNTGGMGSYSPPFFLTTELDKTVLEQIMKPTVKALAAEGAPYSGVLYGGLMVKDGVPRVMEFNARLGDPETQVVMPRLKTDLLDIIEAVLDKRLSQLKIEWSADACVGVVMASGGYPGSFKKGLPITGFEDLDQDILVFHAGTDISADGKIVTSGGRVLTVTATGSTIAKAREIVYNNISRLRFEGSHYRQDIALFKET